MTYTPEIVHDLEPHQVILFGSNLSGRHGAGLARVCMERWGAKLGVAMGPTGRCYAIATVDLQSPEPMTTSFVTQQFRIFLAYAARRPQQEFLVTKIGTGLAGFSMEQMKTMAYILSADATPNVIFPEGWDARLKTPHHEAI
jgi:hypothetical protein